MIQRKHLVIFFFDIFRRDDVYLRISICFICITIVRIKWFLEKSPKRSETATHKLAVLFQKIAKLAYKNTFRKEMQYLKKCKLSAISLQYTRNLLDGRVLKTKN